jgi:4-amino-4-deoxy-L-arabinose transferase-like glycosyltransferase
MSLPRVGWRGLMLLALPLLITLLNPNWLYNPETLNAVDTWIYNGLFRYFFDFAPVPPSSGHYFIERLSWVLPGYVLYNTLPAVLANAVLHLAVYLLTVFSIYRAGARLFTPDAGFLAAACLGVYPWFLRAAGHDYIDGVGIAYTAASIWMMTEAVYRPRFKPYVFGAGVFLGLGLVSQLFLAVMAPPIGLLFLLLNHAHRKHPIVAAVAWGAAGVIAAFLPFIAFNTLALGEPNIFRNSIGFILGSSDNPGLRQFIIRDYGGTPMLWLVLPSLLLGMLVVMLLRWRTVEAEHRVALFSVTGVGAAVLAGFVLMHFVLTYPLLVIYLYMSLIIPWVFLMLAALFGAAGVRLNQREGVLVALMLAAPFALSVTVPALETALRDPWWVWPMLAVASLAFVGLVMLRWRGWGVAAAFSVISMAVGGHASVLLYDRLYNYDIFETTNETLTYLETLEDFAPTTYVVWWDVSQAYQRYSVPFRGMFQPLGVNNYFWYNIVLKPDLYDLLYDLEKPILMFSDAPDVLDRMNAVVASYASITIDRTFDHPHLDPTGAYRGYFMTGRLTHRYGASFFPKGDNIEGIHLLPDNRLATWTGEAEHVGLQANLPAARSDVQFTLCAALATVPPAPEMAATVNDSQAVTLVLQTPEPECDIRYVGRIPQAAFASDGIKTVRFSVPTAPIGPVLGNRNRALGGMALLSARFDELGAP